MKHSLKNCWVIIPALNEEKYIATVLQKVAAVTSNIIVVSDGSTDKTVEIAQRTTPHVLAHRVNLGKGAALKTGCEYAFSQLSAHSVVFFDGDDQHKPELLPEFAEKLETHDVVCGVRSFDNKMPLLRIFLNRLGSFAVLLLFGKYIPDIPCGYKGLTQKAYQKINWKAQDYAVEMEIAARMAQYNLSFDVVSVPTIYHDLDRGMSFLDTLTVITQLISWRLFR